MVTLESLFFTLLGLSTAPGIIPWLLLQWSGGVPRLTPSIWLIGLLPLLAGVGLFFWCNGLFTFIGRGTLAPISAADLPGQIGAVSVGTQSDVSCPLFDDWR